MPVYLDSFNQIVSVGVVFMQITVLVIWCNLVFAKSKRNKVLVFFKENTFLMGFFVALGSVALSLFYSNVIGFPACELCYVQRIFLYPQLVLFSMELYKKDRTIIDHSIALAIFGSLTSIYHMYIENGGSSSLACATGDANTISCATRYVYEFGYVTIPIMAFTASIFIITILLNYKYISKN
jgi:disulfide bond formation protein DsbB